MLNLYLINAENSLSKVTGAAGRSLLKVRTNLKTSPKKKPLEDSQRIKALERGEAFSSKLKNPSFIRDMKPSYVQYDFLVIYIYKT